MSFPFGNIYTAAASIVGKQAYTYYAATGRALDDRGLWVTSYAAGVALNDSIQAVERRLYQALGLNLDRYYIMIYTDSALLVVERDTSGDQIDFNGERYQLLSDTDWRPQDGWRGILAIRQLVTGTP